MLHIFEKILINQIKKGDEQAFAQFYNTYKDKIYSFIYFKVPGKEKADDLVNDTFLKVYRYLRDGHDIDNFRAFLYKTARNSVIDFYRTHQKNISLDSISEIVSKEDVNEKIDNKLEVEKIATAIKQLSNDYQEVIILRFVDGLSFDEISQSTGKSLGNCRMLAHRGIKKVKEIIDNEQKYSV
ncbi:RNA polymerase sigma factor [Patescibacteria group bacterium]|nr:RNA polymerase sigma factor [Patescibacteria group bacterium]